MWGIKLIGKLVALHAALVGSNPSSSTTISGLLAAVTEPKCYSSPRVWEIDDLVTVRTLFLQLYSSVLQCPGDGIGIRVGFRYQILWVRVPPRAPFFVGRINK